MDEIPHLPHKVMQHQLSQQQGALRQTETAYPNMLPTSIEGHFYHPRLRIQACEPELCACALMSSRVCACNSISADGRRYSSVSACALTETQ